MTIAVVILGTALIGLICVNALAIWIAREERRDLSDRVMSLSSPIALTTFKSSQKDSQESNVSYIDEAREYELNPPLDPYEAA